MEERREQVTRLLRDGVGSPEDGERLMQLVYEELRAIAERRMAAERGHHTLQATALVHEAYLRLARDDRMEWTSRGHFFGAAAEAMRRVLVDHARKVKADKRGGGAAHVTLGAVDVAADLDADQVLALSDALDTLAREDERAAAVTRLRFLSGLSVDETAKALGISERSVQREWTWARARLVELLEG
jgi:RNA polymerase sigma factor (TIGR02999 family)